jgi:alpha-tubulin suppressor-like RCC1 family protein
LRWCFYFSLLLKGTIVIKKLSLYIIATVFSVLIMIGSASAVQPQVAAGNVHTVGLKSDGTVVAVGNNNNGECNVSSWTGIVQVAGGGYQTVGLKSDGTVVAV